MSHMSKQEVIDEMISEGYDYDSACRLVFGDTSDYDDKEQTNCNNHSKKLCSECKYIECCDRASVCDGNCGQCDIYDCENNPNRGDK